MSACEGICMIESTMKTLVLKTTIWEQTQLC